MVIISVNINVTHTKLALIERLLPLASLDFTLVSEYKVSRSQFLI